MSRRTILSDPAVPEKPDPPKEPDAPEELTARPRRRDQILRTGGAWLGFSGLYALTAGIVGGILGFGLQAWRKLQK